MIQIRPYIIATETIFFVNCMVRLVHSSERIINKLKKIKQVDTFKPRGLWYAPDKEWINYSKTMRNNKYSYELKLDYTILNQPDKNKVLRILTKKDFYEFTKRYKKDDSDGMIRGINWNKVSKLFGGIDMVKFMINHKKTSIGDYYTFYSRDYIIKWLSGWDIPSGCVWNPKAIKSFSKIS